MNSFLSKHNFSILFFAFTLLIFSCKKIDSDSGLNVNTEQIENFLKINTDAPHGVDLVIKDLRNQLYAENFIDYFLQHHGQPLWNKALMLSGTN
ncbi:MAG: hypothetical protein H0W75_12265, partial [Chitinophagaceae bacterium]|nr:hypothetical protein [Chitinophagaceae bacterium]